MPSTTSSPHNERLPPTPAQPRPKRGVRRPMRYILLVSAAVSTSSASSQDMSGHVLYVCDEKTSSVSLSTVTQTTEMRFEQQKKIGRTAERINFTDLIQHDQDEPSHRTGSEVATRACGRFKVSIEGGFVNWNPNGELGALEFPLVSIELNDEQRSGPISLGTCEKGNSRYDQSSNCPDDWAVTVEAWLSTSEGKEKAVFNLEHSYTEIRGVP